LNLAVIQDRYNKNLHKEFSERKGKLAELDRSFDLKFWQAQSATERFQAAWELVRHAWKVKGNDVR